VVKAFGRVKAKYLTTWIKVNTSNALTTRKQLGFSGESSEEVQNVALQIA